MKNTIIKPFIIVPAVKYYEWGSTESIQNLTGKAELKGKTAAELWMGDHPSGPNMIKEGDKLIPLHTLVKEEGEKLIGDRAYKKFGGRIPFLFKVLAAAKPLSIQSHPSKKQAEEGFERENILEIPLDDFSRGYKDNNHKPEIILALTDFKMMKGFRDFNSITRNFRTYCGKTSGFLFEGLEDLSEKRKIKTFFERTLSGCKSECSSMIEEALKTAEKEEYRDSLEAEMIRKFSVYYPGDTGILSPLYLNCGMIKKGEAVYIPAGELHAYVEGTGIELMANSDNVFRGGLTPKHIDKEELVKILVYNAVEIRKTEQKIKNNETFYITESDEFLLSEITVDDKNTYISEKERNIDILICYDGEAEVKALNGENSTIKVKKGESFAVPSSAGSYSITGSGTFYKATVPL